MHNESSFLNRLSHLRIAIIGDVMVDSYIWGKAERLSPEAPVPVVNVKGRSNRMGGAANVALNIRALGAEPLLFSVTGNDARGEEFQLLMKEAGLNPKGVLRSPDRITTTKHRIIANQNQLLRVDEEMTDSLIPADHERLLSAIRAGIHSQRPDMIVFQDYDKGVITPGLIGEITSLARQEGIGICVDPKREHFMDYKDVLLFKPNLKEIREGYKGNHSNGLEVMMADLQQEIRAELLLVTLSEAGMALRHAPRHGEAVFHSLPAQVRNVADVSGAGDTVISVAALCLAAGYSPVLSASVANVAGGLVCEEVGVVPVRPERLLPELTRLGIDLT